MSAEFLDNRLILLTYTLYADPPDASEWRVWHYNAGPTPTPMLGPNLPRERSLIARAIKIQGRQLFLETVEGKEVQIAVLSLMDEDLRLLYRMAWPEEEYEGMVNEEGGGQWGMKKRRRVC